MSKVVIIAALEREMHPLVNRKGWRKTTAVRSLYGTFESEKAIVICAGIGGTPARRAAEAAITAVNPSMIISAGLAGALAPSLNVGDILIPLEVVYSGSDHRIEVARAPQLPGCCQDGILVSANGIAGPEGKRLLARHYKAQAADMEAAFVGEVALAHHVPFLAVKCVSDEHDFPLPDLEPFVDAEGRFLTGGFVLHTMLRPRTWSTVRKLASNSARASRELCRVLRALLQSNAVVNSQSMNHSERF